ncbi:MAG: MFS transporter [Clostridia bacterium]|nr:MFS transporter [Oscillospiraceae bacterium]MBQ2910810.1 MFS transporter [Clostridia bacterium]
MHSDIISGSYRGIDMKNLKNNIFMPLYFFFYNAAYCLSFGFIVSYLNMMGYESGYVGLVMTLCALLNMVVQPLFGYISETFVPTKYLMLFICGLAIPVGYFIPWSVGIPVIVAASVVLLALLEYPGFPISDMWSVKLGEHFGAINFGFVRSCGSLGYALAALLFGEIFDIIGLEYMFLFHAILHGITILTIIPISKVPLANKRDKTKEKSNISMLQALKILSHNKKYMMFLAGFMFINIGMRFVSSFYPVLIDLKGGTVGQMGTGIFLMALSEIPFIWGFNKYRKWFKIEHIMLFGLSMFTVRNLSMLLAPNVFWLQMAQLTQGLSYGVYVPSLVYYMSSITPKKITTTAISLIGGLVGAIAAVMGNFVGGLVMEAFGAYTSVKICVGLSTLGALIFFASLFVKKTEYEE